MKTITPPLIEPVSLEMAKSHLRVTANDEDVLIGLYIQSAREQAQHRIGKALIAQTLEFALDAFPMLAIELPLANATEIVSIKYLNASGTEITLSASNYYLDNYSLTNWIIPSSGFEWPDTLESANAVTVRYIAGYGTAEGDVPSSVKTWMLLAIGAMYENRESMAMGKVYQLPRDFFDGMLDAERTWRM